MYEPARLFPAVWVEISNKQAWDSLPFSPISRYLGRDFRSAALGGYDENPVLSCTKKHLNIKKWCPLIILCVMPRDSGNTLQGTPLLYY